jgi:hypothetical protein
LADTEVEVLNLNLNEALPIVSITDKAFPSMYYLEKVELPATLK